MTDHTHPWFDYEMVTLNGYKLYYLRQKDMEPELTRVYLPCGKTEALATILWRGGKMPQVWRFG